MQQVVQVYATNSDFLAAWMGQHKNNRWVKADFINWSL
jgi:hypothetical protein